MRERGARAGGLLGAHVSVQGGMAKGPARGAAIGATAIQVFTKTPNQWREPTLARETCGEFRRAWERSGITTIVAHDSYLINLATPDPMLAERSRASFVAELTRCTALGIPWVVSHPGNFIDGREAERIGLVTMCVSPDEVLPKALDVADRLARGSQLAVRWTKRALNNWLRQAGPIFDQSLALEMLSFSYPDVHEGVRAIREKRTPVFPSTK